MGKTSLLLCGDVASKVTSFLPAKSQLFFYHACSGSALESSETFDALAAGIANEILISSFNLFPIFRKLIAHEYINPRHVGKTALRRLSLKKASFGIPNYLAFDLAEHSRPIETHDHLILDGLISYFEKEFRKEPKYFYHIENFVYIFIALQSKLTPTQKTKLLKLTIPLLQKNTASFILDESKKALFDLLIAFFPSLPNKERKTVITTFTRNICPSVAGSFLVCLSPEERQKFLHWTTKTLGHNLNYLLLVRQIASQLTEEERVRIITKLKASINSSKNKLDVYVALSAFPRYLNNNDMRRILRYIDIKSFTPNQYDDLAEKHYKILDSLLPHLDVNNKNFLWRSIRENLPLNARLIKVLAPYADTETQRLILFQRLNDYLINCPFPKLKGIYDVLSSQLSLTQSQDTTLFNTILSRYKDLNRLSRKELDTIFSGAISINDRVKGLKLELIDSLCFFTHPFEFDSKILVIFLLMRLMKFESLWALCHYIGMKISYKEAFLSQEEKKLFRSLLTKASLAETAYPLTSGNRPIVLYAYTAPNDCVSYLRTTFGIDDIEFLEDPNILSRILTDKNISVLRALAQCIHRLVPNEISESTAKAFLAYFAVYNHDPGVGASDFQWQLAALGKDASESLTILKSKKLSQLTPKLESCYLMQTKLKDPEGVGSFHYNPLDTEFDIKVLPNLLSQNTTEPSEEAKPLNQVVFMASALLTQNETQKQALQLVTKYYKHTAFGYKSRWHLFKASSSKHEETGDALKTVLLLNMTEALIKAAQEGKKDFSRAKATIMNRNNSTYSTLSQGQGFFSRVFNRETSSIKALKQISQQLKC